MKIKISFMLIIIGIFVSLINMSYAKIIYDEENNIIYFSGWPLKENQLSQIYSANLKSGEVKSFYKAENGFLAYHLDCDKSIIFCIKRNNETNQTYDEESIILNKEGKVIKEIKDVISWTIKEYFSWSPDGEKIVYVTGKSIMEGHYLFEPKGVFIYDIQKDNIMKISEKGVDVKWAKYDNKIYIQNNFLSDSEADVSVYDPKSGQLTKSDKKGIIFSDDGKYYIAKKVIGFAEEAQTEYSVYDNSNNKPVYKFSENEKYLLDESHGNYWFIKGTHNLLIVGSRSYKVFDVDKQKTIAKWNKILIGLNKDMTKGIIYEGGGKFVHIVFLIDGIKIKSVPIPQQ
jgi:hypothetical protein